MQPSGLRPITSTPAVFGAGTSVPTSWTSLVTTAVGEQVLIKLIQLFETTTETKTVTLALLEADGTTRVTLFDKDFTTAGDTYTPTDTHRVVVVPPNWAFQIMADGSNSIHYYVAGEVLIAA